MQMLDTALEDIVGLVEAYRACSDGEYASPLQSDAIWQRQIQRLPCARARASTSATGCGSWTTMKSSVHTHTGYRSFAYADYVRTPVVTTLHGRIDTPGMADVLRAFPAVHLVSISQAQRAPAPDAPWAATIYHGLDPTLYPFGGGGDNLVFLGRFSPEKAPHVAIDVAVAAGIPITLAGRIDPVDKAFFDREVKPRMAHPLVRFAGEVDHDEKVELLRSARALLFPIDWPEPFGLVMIEAMACGTPVIARPNGSAPEIVVDRVTGILEDNVDALVEAVKAARRLDRRKCRLHVEANFSVRAMIDRYESLYEELRLSGAHCGTQVKPPHVKDP